MKFNKIIAAFAFILILSENGNVYGSLKPEIEAGAPTVKSVLQGEDTEDKVADAIARFLGEPLNPDISEFEGLKGRGSDHLDSFERARDLFVELAEAINGMHEAFSLMLTEFASNTLAKTTGNFIKLMTSDDIDDEDYVAFNRGMGWSTLRLKFKMVSGYTALHEALQAASDKHIELKTTYLQRQYASIARKLPPLQASWAKIDDLYPGMTAPFEVQDVSVMDLSELKDNVPAFKEAVEAYSAELTPAKKWQSAFTAYHKKHTAFVEERAKIEVGFATLREANDENEELPVGDLPELTSLDGMGELEDIQGVLSALEEEMKGYRAQLARARKWKPAPPVVAEVAADDAAAVEEDAGAGAAVAAAAIPEVGDDDAAIPPIEGGTPPAAEDGLDDI